MCALSQNSSGLTLVWLEEKNKALTTQTHHTVKVIAAIGLVEKRAPKPPNIKSPMGFSAVRTSCITSIEWSSHIPIWRGWKAGRRFYRFAKNCAEVEKEWKLDGIMDAASDRQPVKTPRGITGCSVLLGLCPSDLYIKWGPLPVRCSKGCYFLSYFFFLLNSAEIQQRLGN